MTLSHSWEKRAFSALFLFLLATSCSSSSCPKWQIEETITCSPCYNSGKIFFPPPDEFSGLELELARGPDDVRMYINVFSIEISGEADDSNAAQVLVDFGGEAETFTANILQGGQRLLLPPEATERILSSLLDGDYITISVDRYKAEIPSENFPKLYNSLCDIPTPSTLYSFY